jgi:hypothetical protein
LVAFDGCGPAQETAATVARSAANSLCLVALAQLAPTANRVADTKTAAKSTQVSRRPDGHRLGSTPEDANIRVS